MTVWNAKLFFLALPAPAAAAFFLPQTSNPVPTLLRANPDAWLGSSPSDHYGGAVGPKFDPFEIKSRHVILEEEPPATFASEPTQVMMEAQSFQDWSHPPEGTRLPPAEGFPIGMFRSIPDQPGEWFYHDVKTGSARPAWPRLGQQQTIYSFQDGGSMGGGLGHSPRVQPIKGSTTTIEPSNWDLESRAAEAWKMQKKIPSGHSETPFQSREVPTPPKLIRPDRPAPSETIEAVKPQDSPQERPFLAKQKSVLPFDESKQQSNKQRLPPAEGFPISEFRSIPDQPGEWFYHNVESGSTRPAWPGQNQTPKVYSFQNRGAKLVDASKSETLYEAETTEVTPDTFGIETTTPLGEPKQRTPREGAESQVKTTMEAPADDASLLPIELQVKDGRLPPAEGFPISEFRSIPDQPGEWFYDNVNSGQTRPNWPSVREQQQVHSFQEKGEHPFEGRVTGGFSSTPHQPGAWFQPNDGERPLAAVRAEEERTEPAMEDTEKEGDGDSTVSM